MGGTNATGDDQRDSTGTLGELLYADPAQTRASEEDWARLVRSIAERDQRALRALYERAHRLVFTLIMRITNDKTTAEEVTLDVFHGIWQRAAEYDPAGGTVIGWIMNQARSRAIDRLRFEQRKKRVARKPDDPTPVATMHGPGDALEDTEQGRLLRHALTMLTPDERQAIEVAYFSELTYSQTAARLNEPLGTVKTRIRSGLGKLRQAFAAPGTES